MSGRGTSQRQLLNQEMRDSAGGDGRDIIMSANNNEEIIVFPIVPEISVSTSQKNEEFQTADRGFINMVGDVGLRQFSWDSIFPVFDYHYLRPGSVAKPFIYVDFINKWRSAKVPIRVITSRHDGRPWFNLPMLIDEFEYTLLKSGNITYSLSLTEYVFHSEVLR